ncbi:MAG TPA: hypothetical protein PKY59_08410 [Pyrinomonadaceae bacterium]|nr:hypothetical protein [Pyrinomonadaceae bacterium]
MKYSIPAFFILLFAISVFPQKSAYKLLFDDDNLTVKYQKKHYKLRLGEAIDASKITEAELLFADKKNDFTYLVVAVSGQSKSQVDDGHCGAGMESNLIWVKLNSRLKVVSHKSQRFESCWTSIVSDEGYVIKGKTLQMSVDNVSEKTTTEIFYDSANPDKGFKVEIKKMAKSY